MLFACLFLVSPLRIFPYPEGSLLAGSCKISSLEEALVLGEIRGSLWDKIWDCGEGKMERSQTGLSVANSTNCLLSVRCRKDCREGIRIPPQ